MTDHLEAAMEEAGDAIYEKLFAYGLAGTDAQEAAKAAITDALPHLRLAIIQELANEALAETLAGTVGHVVPRTPFAADQWLRAKLKEAENND